MWSCGWVSRCRIFCCVGIRRCGPPQKENPTRSFLTRDYLTFILGDVPVAFDNRATATSVRIRFVASKTDQKRTGCTITRTRIENAGVTAAGPAGAVEPLLELLDVPPHLPGKSTLTTRWTPKGW